MNVGYKIKGINQTNTNTKNNKNYSVSMVTVAIFLRKLWWNFLGFRQCFQVVILCVYIFDIMQLLIIQKYKSIICQVECEKNWH